MCGDFNITIYPSEKRNCRRRTPAMIDFSDFIEDMDLIDLQLEGVISLGSKVKTIMLLLELIVF